MNKFIIFAIALLFVMESVTATELRARLNHRKSSLKAADSMLDAAKVDVGVEEVGNQESQTRLRRFSNPSTPSSSSLALIETDKKKNDFSELITGIVKSIVGPIGSHIVTGLIDSIGEILPEAVELAPLALAAVEEASTEKLAAVVQRLHSNEAVRTFLIEKKDSLGGLLEGITKSLVGGLAKYGVSALIDLIPEAIEALPIAIALVEDHAQIKNLAEEKRMQVINALHVAHEFLQQTVSVHIKNLKKSSGGGIGELLGSIFKGAGMGLLEGVLEGGVEGILGAL